MLTPLRPLEVKIQIYVIHYVVHYVVDPSADDKMKACTHTVHTLQLHTNLTLGARR